MPNSNRPMGLLPISRSVAGGNLQTVKRSKLASYATVIRSNDIVARAAGGAITRVFTPGTTNIEGVSLNYGAASKATDHLILQDPTQLYQAQGGA